MIIGIGTDICDNSRISELIDKYKDNFFQKVLSEEELNLVKNKDETTFVAGRFAAKEAIQKAISTPPLDFSQISILNDSTGKPYISKLPDNCKHYLNKKHNIQISISHERKFSTAFAIIEKL